MKDIFKEERAKIFNELCDLAVAAHKETPNSKWNIIPIAHKNWTDVIPIGDVVPYSFPTYASCQEALNTIGKQRFIKYWKSEQK